MNTKYFLDSLLAVSLNINLERKIKFVLKTNYEGCNFNSGNYLFTTDTKQIHVSKVYCPSL